MSARRIARELAVIMLPQLPRDKTRLDKIEFGDLATRAVQMLEDYAKQCLADANGLLIKCQSHLQELEVEHPENEQVIDELKPVAVTTGQLRQQADLLERSLHLISEALDLPQVTAQLGPSRETEARMFLYRLVSTYLDRKVEIDKYITDVKAKWRIERMISIDRDILRLACAEAFFMPDVPIKVAISEAVELSHRFADEKAAKFINGILGELAEHAKQRRQADRIATAGDTTDAETSGREPVRRLPS
jgi:N utilization substance protein B